MVHLETITAKMKRLTQADRDLIHRAYEVAKKAHEGQTRYNGEPYFTHLEKTAEILAEWNMDAATIAAGLLHDTIEDTPITVTEIEKEFGKDILFLIEGVTKLGKLKYHGLERHVESLRKLFVATSKDIRVLIIKLADKLHNMQTLEHVPQEKQRRLALEALEIYAPLANRLGMGKVKGALEDLVFPYLFPKEYEETMTLLKQRSKTDHEYLEKVYRSLKKEFAKHNMPIISLDYRVKHIYSLWRKLQKYHMDIEKIYDIVALRIIVKNVEECYRVLGIIHNMWRPLPGRIKDYVAVPKPNGYRSLHTTIFTGDGGIAEIQIRTQEMHDEAEYGIAAWFAYKEAHMTKNTRGGQDEKSFRNFKEKFRWVEDLQNLHREQLSSGELLQDMKMDLFEDRIFIFTPKGDVVDLPNGSGPIDFAYAIHSDIGHHTSGARINRKLASLDTKLKNGDIVEIVTKKDSHPSSKWLEYAQTSSAKKHIKQYLNDNSLIKKFLTWNDTPAKSAPKNKKPNSKQ